MKEPDLSENYFLRDRLLSFELLAGSEAFAPLGSAMPAGEAGCFTGSQRLSITISLPFKDLSRFNQFSLAVLNRSAAPLLVGMKLVYGSEEADSDTPDISFSGGREELHPGSWRDLKFPIAAFGTYGTPKGWTNIRDIELTFGYERNHQGSPHIEACLRTLEGRVLELPQGPRLTLEGLPEVLKEESRQTFASSYGPPASPSSFRPFVSGDSGLFIPPPHPYPRESADQILTGRIMGQWVTDPIQWNANPLGVQEWTHFLNRHHFLRELVTALDRTGDEKYAGAQDRIIADWIKNNPVPVDSNGGAGPAWETLSAAWRIREWLWVRGIAWNHDSFSQETRVAMMRSIWEHARSLVDHKGHPNNWLIVESAALALVGICFPEFRDAHHWMLTGLQRLEFEMDRQFLSDGVHFEISPLYHAICFHALLDVKVAATSRRIPLSDAFAKRLEQSADYLVALCRPDFTWPSLNDSGSVNGDYSALLRKAAQVLHRDDLLWVGTKGSEGTPPQETLRVFPSAGIATMRSHYGSDANHLVFRAGPPGAFHEHADVLSLDVTTLGRPRLVDPGITTYAPDLLSDYYRSAAAHNMLLIDGREPDRAGISFPDKIRSAEKDFSFTSQDSVLTITGIFRGPWRGTEELYRVVRDIIFVKGEYWIVRDSVFGRGEHEISTCWQFSPARVELDIETLAARTLDAKGMNLTLFPVLAGNSPTIEIFTGSLRPPRGWVSVDGSDLPATLCIYRITERLPATFVWLMLPVSETLASSTTGTLTSSEGRTTQLEVIFPERHRDVITLSHHDVDGTLLVPRIELERIAL